MHLLLLLALAAFVWLARRFEMRHQREVLDADEMLLIGSMAMEALADHWTPTRP